MAGAFSVLCCIQARPVLTHSCDVEQPRKWSLWRARKLARSVIFPSSPGSAAIQERDRRAVEVGQDGHNRKPRSVARRRIPERTAAARCAATS